MKKLLLAVDGSEMSLKALEQGAQLAQAFGSEATIITVVYEQPIYPIPGAVIPPDLAESRKSLLGIMEDASQKMVDHLAKEKFDSLGIKVQTMVKVGRPADEILKEAEQGEYDMIIMGSRGLTGIQRVLMGTVSGKVTNNAKCTVVVVR